MNLLLMSILGACMILVVIAIRFLAKNHLPKKAFMILWGIVLIRLLVPVFFSITVPNKEVPQKVNAILVLDMICNMNQNSTTLDNNEEYVPTDLLENKDINIAYENQETTRDEKLSKTTIDFVFTCIWGLGSFCIVIWSLISYRRVYRTLCESIPLNLEWVSSWAQDNHIHRKIQVRCSDQIKSPLTYGILKPKIVLPKTMDLTNQDDMLFIMNHELVHIKSFDNLRKLIMQIALCIHWFNPMVWLMQRYYHRDIEVNCDARVLKILGEECKEAYALTLINFAEKSRNTFVVYSGFGENIIHERIVSIMKYKKRSITSVAIAAVLIIFSTILFAQGSLKEEVSSKEKTTYYLTRTNGIAYHEDIVDVYAVYEDIN